MDPLKKDLYTAKRASGLNTSADPNLSTIVEQLVAEPNSESDDSPRSCKWMIMKIVNGNALTVHAHGLDGVAGLLGALNDDDIYFSVIQVYIQEKIKYIHVFYVGGNVSAIKRGKGSLQKTAAFDVVPAHGEITIESGELTSINEQWFINKVSELFKIDSAHTRF